MTSRFTELVVDCQRPHELAAFWCAVLDYEVIDTGDDLVEIAGWHPSAETVRAAVTAPTVLFIRVPESKTVKNRLHIDVSPINRGHDEEVERVLALGARRVDIGQGEQRWDVLADPEGKEFCVVRSLHP